MQIVYNKLENYNVITVNKIVTCPAMAYIEADELIKKQECLGDVILIDGENVVRINNPEKD